MTLPTLFRGHPRTRARVAAWPAAPLDQIFDELWRGVDAPSASAVAAFAPRVELSERADDFVLTAELPGVSESDLHVEIHGDVLTLRGEKRAEKVENVEKRYVSERVHGRFERSLRLPTEVDSANVRATHTDGVLTVTLPKAESARARQIPIESA